MSGTCFHKTVMCSPCVMFVKQLVNTYFSVFVVNAEIMLMSVSAAVNAVLGFEPHRGEIVEVCGREGSGKTESMLHLVSKFLLSSPTGHASHNLPTVTENDDGLTIMARGCVDGCCDAAGYRVVWLDCDSTFSAARLADVIRQQTADRRNDRQSTIGHPHSLYNNNNTDLMAISGPPGNGSCPRNGVTSCNLEKDGCSNGCGHSEKAPPVCGAACSNVAEGRISNSDGPDFSMASTRLKALTAIVHDSLRRVLVVRCTSSYHLLSNLYQLQSTVIPDEGIGLLLLDPVSQFYWADRAQDKNEAFLRNRMSQLTRVLLRIATSHDVLVVATRQVVVRKRTRKQAVGSACGSNNHEFMCTGRHNPDDRMSPCSAAVGRTEVSAISNSKVTNPYSSEDRTPFLGQAWSDAVCHQFTVSKSHAPRHGANPVFTMTDRRQRTRSFTVNTSGLLFTSPWITSASCLTSCSH